MRTASSRWRAARGGYRPRSPGADPRETSAVAAAVAGRRCQTWRGTSRRRQRGVEHRRVDFVQHELAQLRLVGFGARVIVLLDDARAVIDAADVRTEHRRACLLDGRRDFAHERLETLQRVGLRRRGPRTESRNGSARSTSRFPRWRPHRRRYHFSSSARRKPSASRSLPSPRN